MQSQPIRAIFFDFQGVMRRRGSGNSSALLAKIERDFGLRAGTLDDLNLPESCGRGERWRAIEARLSLLLQRPVSLRSWQERSDQKKLIAENIDLVRSLRGRYQLGIVANSDGSVEDRMRSLDVRGYFDDVVDSEVVGIRKPNIAIYKLAAERLGVTPEECVFIDDKRENIVGAEAAGMLGVYYSCEDGDDLAAILSARGISLEAPSPSRKHRLALSH